MKLHPKPKFFFYETLLPKAVVGYRIDRDMTTDKIAVTLFWQDFFGFTGLGDTMVEALGEAIAQREKFFRDEAQLATVQANASVEAQPASQVRV